MFILPFLGNLGSHNSMKVVDAEGRFVGFVKDIVGQKLLIGRPAQPDVEVPMASCKMSENEVRLPGSGSQVDAAEGS